MNIKTEDLYEFVARADTLKKITIAERWLRNNAHLMSRHTLDDLISILEAQNTYLVIKAIQEYEKRVISLEYARQAYTDITDDEGGHYLTEIASGEIILADI